MMPAALRRFAGSRHGSVAVEFLAVAPVMLIMLVGIVDIGNVLFTRFRLNAAVAAGVNYSIVRAADVSGANAGAMASSVAKLVASSSQTDDVAAVVVVNHGPTATVNGAGDVAMSGTAGATTNALCYCPTSAGDWSVSQTCGVSCGSGLAGRFVQITASKSYTPLFSSYGIVHDGTIVATNMVQTQ